MYIHGDGFPSLLEEGAESLSRMFKGIWDLRRYTFLALTKVRRNGPQVGLVNYNSK